MANATDTRRFIISFYILRRMKNKKDYIFLKIFYFFSKKLLFIYRLIHMYTKILIFIIKKVSFMFRLFTKNIKYVKIRVRKQIGETYMDEEFAYLILAIVMEIPKGKVVSYGQLAKLAGYPKNARKVGKVLSNASLFGSFPCHRVIHSDGSLVQGWSEQQDILESEGIVFTRDGFVNMKTYQWKG
jgi:methylated-DNA-protein-cysteine methyltransferase-like protein